MTMDGTWSWTRSESPVLLLSVDQKHGVPQHLYHPCVFYVQLTYFTTGSTLDLVLLLYQVSSSTQGRLKLGVHVSGTPSTLTTQKSRLSDTPSPCPGGQVKIQRGHSGSLPLVGGEEGSCNVSSKRDSGVKDPFLSLPYDRRVEGELTETGPG